MSAGVAGHPHSSLTQPAGTEPTHPWIPSTFLVMAVDLESKHCCYAIKPLTCFFEREEQLLNDRDEGGKKLAVEFWYISCGFWFRCFCVKQIKHFKTLALPGCQINSGWRTLQEAFSVVKCLFTPFFWHLESSHFFVVWGISYRKLAEFNQSMKVTCSSCSPSWGKKKNPNTRRLFVLGSSPLTNA